MEIMFDTKNI